MSLPSPLPHSEIPSPMPRMDPTATEKAKTSHLGMTILKSSSNTVRRMAPTTLASPTKAAICTTGCNIRRLCTTVERTRDGGSWDQLRDYATTSSRSPKSLRLEEVGSIRRPKETAMPSFLPLPEAGINPSPCSSVISKRLAMLIFTTSLIQISISGQIQL